MMTNTVPDNETRENYAEDFSVSRVFSDDMVLQRGEYIRVWGFAPEHENGKTIAGEFKGLLAKATVENGEWCLTFATCLAADPVGATMSIYTDKKTVSFQNVLVGDVYMVIGQSNVESSVSSHIAGTDATTQGGGKEAIDPDSLIRLNRTSSNSGGNFPDKGTANVYKDLMNTKQWTKTTEADTLAFSAVGYYFAKAVAEKTDHRIPIGIIEIGFSGAPLGSFLPNEIAEKYGTDTVHPTTGKYVTTGVNSNIYPGRGIYNCHIAPFEEYAIAGLVWYQGESNNTAAEAVKYNEVFTALMTHMRGTHNLVNRDFPVFFVEFPSIYQRPAGFTGAWHFMELGMIRAYMGAIPTMLKNSYISVSNDLWDNREFFNSLHPNCKFEQAQRLACLADAVLYDGIPLDKATGPVFESVTIGDDGKRACITFTNVGEGLETLDGTNAVLGFVGFARNSFGLSKSVMPQSTRIMDRHTVELTFPTEIKAVAYNYESEDFFGKTLNLCNSYGTPAPAFLTPFTDGDCPTVAYQDLLSYGDKSVGSKGKSVDTLTVDGTAIFSTGNIEYKLTQAGGKAKVPEGSMTLNTYGWAGFSYDILRFGYAIDGSDAVFPTAPSTPQQAVIAVGGQYAKRFSIDIPVQELSAGNHKVDVLALIDTDNGVGVTLFSFTLVVE